MEKRAQVTIFIVIGIILVASIAVFFLIKGKVINKPEVTPETQNIYSFIEECIKQTGEEVVYRISNNGGYYFSPEFSTESGVPIYYSEGKNYMPAKKNIEDEISDFVSKKLFFCARNFADFPDYKIKQSEIKTETSILDNKVILNIEYPLEITKGEKTNYLSNFENIEIPARLGIIYNAVYNLTQEQLTSNAICLNCLSDIVSINDLYVDMIDYDDETMLFIFRDENSKINNQSLKFIYASRYKK